MEMTVEVNKGYVLPDRQERRSQMRIGTIPMGAAFTPVRKVNYTVEADSRPVEYELGAPGAGSLDERHHYPETAISEAAKILTVLRPVLQFPTSERSGIRRAAETGAIGGQPRPSFGSKNWTSRSAPTTA